MEIKLNGGSIAYLKTIFDTTVVQEETCELSVADNMPDILRIAQATSVVTVKNKAADTGRVTVNGSVALCVMYCPEGADGLRRITADLPFTCTYSDGQIGPETNLSVSCRVISADASFTTSRKCVARVILSTALTGYEPDTIYAGREFACDDTELELQTEEYPVTLPVTLTEKSLVLSDEHDLPQPGDGELLGYSVHAAAEDYKIVGNKVVIRGQASYKALLRTPAGVEDLSYNKEFSQILELDEIQPEDQFRVTFMLTGTYAHIAPGLTGESGKVVSEIQLLTQCLQRRSMTIVSVKDAYGIGCRLEPEKQTYSLPCQEQLLEKTELFVQTIETPEPVKRVLNTQASCAAVSQEGGGLRTTLYISVLYLDQAEKIQSLARIFEVTSVLEDAAAEKMTLQALVPEVYAAAGGGGVDIRASVRFQAITEKMVSVESVTGGELMAEAGQERRSLVLRRVMPGEDLWQIAKQYMGRRETILAVNGLEKQEIVPGSMLLVPVGR